MKLNQNCMKSVLKHIIENTNIDATQGLVNGINVISTLSKIHSNNEFDIETIAYAILKLYELGYITMDYNCGWNNNSLIKDVTYSGHIWFQSAE